MKKLICKWIGTTVILAIILNCYGCGPSAAVMAGVLTHGNSRAVRDAFMLGTAVDLTAGNIALAKLSRVEQQPVVVAEPAPAEFIEPEQAEFVEPVIVYNEPCYLPCPIVVGFPYEYYTYENVGGFVNIVFWQNGHRFRHEEWRYHGERMRPDRMHEWARSHKVNRGVMEHHRNQLVQRHNIRHDDAHYGLRPTTHAQKDSRNPSMRQQVQRTNESSLVAQKREPQQRPSRVTQQRTLQQRPQPQVAQRLPQQRPQQTMQQRPQQTMQQRPQQQRQQQSVQQRTQQRPQQAAQKKNPNQPQ